MEPIFTDKEVRQILYMYKLDFMYAKKNQIERHQNEPGDETLYYKLAKAVRDAVEDKFHALAEEAAAKRDMEGMKYVREIGRLLSETRRED